MIQLFSVIASVMLIFVVQKYSPLASGFIAVIPVKIIATALFSYQDGGTSAMLESLKGVLIGQFTVGFVLLFIYAYLKGWV